MGFIEAIKSGFDNYVNFSGRAIRSEYWYWALFTMIGGVVTYLFDGATGVPITEPLFSLATLVPGLAVSVRRLHDLDRTGWWLLLLFIPLIGAIVLIVWFCKKGADGQNRFGPDRFAELTQFSRPQAA